MIKAEYIDHMGTDLTVVNAARVSMDKESSWRKKGSRKLHTKDKKLLKYLARENHWSPFSHPQITMRETVPIFVARQRFKHMVGFTYNEISRRYVSDNLGMYTPDSWRAAPEGSIKQGSGEDLSDSMQEECNKVAEHVNHESLTVYYYMLNVVGVAPEQARSVLPQSMLTSYYVTGSLSAWARAYKLRNESHSQKEIQGLARQWGKIIKPHFPKSWKALINGG